MSRIWGSEMNERIKELYLQAAEIAVKEEPTDLLAGQLIQMQKFAELIVGECTAIMHKDTSPNCPYVDYSKVTNEIKQHFGVGP